MQKPPCTETSKASRHHKCIWRCLSLLRLHECFLCVVIIWRFLSRKQKRVIQYCEINLLCWLLISHLKRNCVVIDLLYIYKKGFHFLLTSSPSYCSWFPCLWKHPLLTPVFVLFYNKYFLCAHFCLVYLVRYSHYLECFISCATTSPNAVVIGWMEKHSSVNQSVTLSKSVKFHFWCFGVLLLFWMSFYLKKCKTSLVKNNSNRSNRQQ